MSQSKYGISLDSEFILESEDQLTVETVKDKLSVEPTIPLKVKQISNKEFKVSLEREMDYKNIYRFSYDKDDDEG